MGAIPCQGAGLMSQALTQPKLTFEEYLKLLYDGRITEFVGGEIIEVAAPRPRHGRILKKLINAFDAYIEKLNLDWEALSNASSVRTPKPEKPDNGHIPDLVIGKPISLS